MFSLISSISLSSICTFEIFKTFSNLINLLFFSLNILLYIFPLLLWIPSFECFYYLCLFSFLYFNCINLILSGINPLLLWLRLILQFNLLCNSQYFEFFGFNLFFILRNPCWGLLYASGFKYPLKISLIYLFFFLVLFGLLNLLQED